MILRLVGMLIAAFIRVHHWCCVVRCESYTRCGHSRHHRLCCRRLRIRGHQGLAEGEET